MEDILERIEQRLYRIERMIEEPADDLLPVDEAAKVLGISRSAVYEKTCCRDGLPPELPHYKHGKRLFFSRRELQELIRANRIRSRHDVRQEGT